MKKSYIIIGIIILIIIIGIISVYLFSKKAVPDYNPIISENESGNFNNINVNNSLNQYPDSYGPMVLGNYSLTLKVKNPQYKQGNEVFFIYEIKNLDNSSLVMSKNTKSGIEIKSSTGTAPKYYNSSDKLVILKEDINIFPLQKKSFEFSINSDDFSLTGLNPTEGSYYAVIIDIGEVKSNKAMVRILK